MESRRRHRASSDDFEAPVQPKYPQVPLAMLKDALTTYTSHMPYDPEKEVDSQARAELLFNYFADIVDVNGDGFVTDKEMKTGFQTMIRDWKSLNKSWGGHQTVSRAYHISTGVVYFIVAIVVWMLVFNINYQTFLLPLTTLAVATAYATGGSVSLAMQALMFIVTFNPYEIGDKVIVEGIQGDKSMVVLDITVTTTSFGLPNGRRVMISNQVLMSKNIVNLKRSSNAGFTLKFTMGHRTSRAQLEAFESKIKGYLRRHSVDWKPSFEFTVDEGSVSSGLICFLSVTHVKAWQEGGDIAGAKSKLVQAAIKYQIELGIEYLEPATMCLERPGQQREPEEEEEEEDAVGPSASAAVSTRTRTSAPRRFFQGEATGTPSTATASLGMWK